MALAVANRDGGKTSERGFSDSLRSLVSGNVISGFRVRENSPLGMSVRIGGEYNATTGANRDSALIDDGIRCYQIFTDDGAAVTATVDAAHASLPRVDSVVLYIDKSVARSTAVLDNSNGVVKAKVVAGTPASTPAAPSASAIQSSIGASNPYIVIGQVSVSAAVTQITDAKITDQRTLSGAKIADSAISTAKLADGAVTPAKTSGIWWEELGRTTLGSAGDTITVSGLPVRKYLKILVATQPTGGTIRNNMRFNNDSAANYSFRYSANGGVDGTVTSQSNLTMDFSAGAYPYFIEVDVVNISAQEKLCVLHSSELNNAGAASAPNRIEIIGKWANTSSQITRVDLINGGTGDFAIGSEVVVLGHN